MSMEQAILEHAGALREHAGALRELAAAMRERNAPINAVVGQISEAVEEVKTWGKESPVEAVKADEKLPNDETIAAMKEAEQLVANREKADAELEAAVSKVEEESKALDYKTDVRPVLLALAKKAGQPALKDLLTKYGAATGDKLTPDQFAGIVADANALIAG